MRVVHVPGSDEGFAVDHERTLATRVDVADDPLTRLRGVMLWSSIPAEYALVFPFDSPGRRWIHTVLVRVPIDVVWTVGEEVTRVERLPPWRGVAGATADRVVEFGAGTAADVAVGDTVRVEDSRTGHDGDLSRAGPNGSP